MQLADNFRKFTYVMRTVKHWQRTTMELSHWKADGLKQIELVFKDNQAFHHVTHGDTESCMSMLISCPKPFIFIALRITVDE